MNKTSKQRSVFESAGLVTIMMLAFKVIGFIKQAVIAYFFGANTTTDAYFVAYGFVTGLAEAIVRSVSVSIVAIYSYALINKGKRKADYIVNGIMEIMMPIALILVGILCLFAPTIVEAIAPSYSKMESFYVQKYVYILSPLILFSTIELIFCAILDAHKNFIIGRLQSLIYSVTIILSCFLLSDIIKINALIVGQYISSIIFTIILVFTMRKYCRFSIVKVSEVLEIKEVLLTAIPLLIGNGAIQLNQIVDKAISTGLEEGTASALSYCHTLEQFVTNIMIVNIGNVLFAHFADYVANHKIENIQSTLKKAINIMIYILLPISVITILCSREIVTIVYLRGNFNSNALYLTAIALAGYAIAFPMVAVRDLTIKSIYAFGDTKQPMKASIVSIICNIALSITFSKYIGILGIALATSLSVFIGMLINMKALKKHLKEYCYAFHLKTALKSIPGLICMTIVIFWIKKMGENSFVIFTMSCLIGGVVYIMVSYVCKVDEIREFIYKVLRRGIKNE